jgi:hypothetical protein
MDPDACLTEFRQLAARPGRDEHDAARLRELVQWPDLGRRPPASRVDVLASCSTGGHPGLRVLGWPLPLSA